MISIAPGRYIIAVSGGVDSMALLDMARRQPGVQLIVAHVNHGTRIDAAQDTQLVAQYARTHQLQLVTTSLQLGSQASEAVARVARYNFLQSCRKKYNAKAILVAHHQDDLIETAIIAIMRGTAWRGLAPFVTNNAVVRPLLAIPKHRLIGYARAQHVPWREDTTNTNESYLRNYIRHTLCPMLDQKSEYWRDKFLQLIRKQQQLRRTIEEDLHRATGQMASIAQGRTIYKRYAIIMATATIAYELLQQIFRYHTGNSLEAPLAYRAYLFVRVAKPGKRMPLGTGWQVRVTTSHFIVEPTVAMIRYNK